MARYPRAETFKIKRFGGKIYKPFYWHKKKSAVEKQAVFQRTRGYSARIVKVKDKRIGTFYQLYLAFSKRRRR